MNWNKQYILILLGCILLALVLTGCAEFETKMEEMRNQQMTCAEEEQSLCAGWKV